MLTNEALLLAYIRRDDAFAFLALFKRYERRLASFFRKGVSDQEDCRDLVQQTYTDLLDSKAFKSNGIKDFEKFLFKLAFYKRCEYYRSKQKNAHEVVDSEQVKQLGQIAYISELALLELKEQRLQRLQQAIVLLPQQQQKATLLQLQGKKYDEIAVAMGISATNVGTLINRARQRLRKMLNT